MRVLVTYGSKRGGTEGIARTVAEALGEAGIEPIVQAPGETAGLNGFDAVIVGGALYANRWPLRLRWFVARHAALLQSKPVWFFSSGPLDDSAERREIPPTRSVRRLMRRIGARGHATFGGRLASDARGFLASRMAKTQAGDWRNREQIRAWAIEVARTLGGARPSVPPPSGEAHWPA